MENNKSYFQRVSTNLEMLLSQYKNQYPQNYGTLIRDFFPLLLITIPILVFFYGVFYKLNERGAIMAVLVGPVFLIFGIVLLFRKNKECNSDSGVVKKINSLKSQLTEYSNYPDVKQYLEKFDSQKDEVVNKKNKMLSRFKIFKILYFVFVGVLCIYWFVAGFLGMNELKNEYSSNFFHVLELKEKSPFLVLKPLKTKVEQSVDIITPQIDIFLIGTTDKCLTIKKLQISNADNDKFFRLMITDENGKPVSQCPKFVFSGGQNEKINSLPICFDKKKKEQNDFMALQLLKYLQDNEKKLYFVVEQI